MKKYVQMMEGFIKIGRRKKGSEVMSKRKEPSYYLRDKEGKYHEISPYGCVTLYQKKGKEYKEHAVYLDALSYLREGSYLCTITDNMRTMTTTVYPDSLGLQSVYRAKEREIVESIRKALIKDSDSLYDVYEAIEKAICS